MNTKNLQTTSFFIYFLSFIAFVFQIILFDNFNDLVCIFILFLSNILTTYYCFNKKYFFQYPITLLMIFLSHFINLGGALYFKSLEFSLVTQHLRLPLSTITNLALFNLVIILSHSIYRNMKIANNIKISIKNFLEKFEFYNFREINLFYVLSIIAIAARLLYYDLSIPLEAQGSLEGPNLLRDILYGFNNILFLPVVIFFSNSLYGVKTSYKKNFFFIIFVLFVIFLSTSRNNRSLFFDTIFITAIIFFLLFLFNKIQTDKGFYLKFILVLILIFPTINLFENLSRIYLAERFEFKSRTPVENFKSFVNNMFNKENLIIYEERQSSEDLIFFGENYYNKSIYNRINILLTHDNFNYIKTALSKKQINDLLQLQINKTISILPQPIINIFTKSFYKREYNQYSTASFLYGNIDYMYGNLNMGSALMTLYIVFDQWTYLMLVFVFIPFFIFFESFYNDKLMIFSPFILIFFYTTGLGIFNFFAVDDISGWFTLAFRTIPQTLLFIFIIKYFFKLFVKKNVK